MLFELQYLLRTGELIDIRAAGEVPGDGPANRPWGSGDKDPMLTRFETRELEPDDAMLLLAKSKAGGGDGNG